MRLERVLLVVAILVAISRPLIAQDQVQDLPQFTPPSPNAASLGKYGDIQIGKYTGSTNVSIPIHTLRLGKFSLPIDLNYTTSGLKVEEASSLVGLGWSLNAGGVITRTVHGLPDEGYLGYWQVGDLPDSVLIGNVLPASLYFKGMYDLEPDMFYFNFAGHSGKFVLDTTSAHNAHCIPYQNMRIQHDGSLSNFTLTDDEGNIYYFGATETTLSEGNTSTSNYTSTWYLTKITTSYGTVTLTYNGTPEKSTSFQVSEVDYTGFTGTIESNKGGSNNFSTTDVTGKMISQISAGDERINFYGTQDRSDMVQASMLDSIIVTDNKGITRKRFILKHSYFGNTSGPTFQSMRLKLDSVIEESIASDQPQIYALTYYYPAEVPPTSSNAQDFWGFYNGQTGNSTLLPSVDATSYPIPSSLLGANRSPDAGSAKTGCLQTIKYPTGGTSTFIYEGNDYGYVANTPVNQIPILTHPADVGVTVFTANQTNLSDATIIHVTAAGNATVKIYGNYGPHQEAPLDNGPSIYLYKLLSDGGQSTVIQALSINQSSTTTQTQYLDTGYYKLVATVDPVVGETVTLNVIYDSLGGTTIKTLPIGGIRIKQVINTVPVSGAQNIKSYKYTLPWDATRSSGNIMSSYEFVDFIGGYLVRSSYSKNYLGATQGGDVGYEVVTEFDTQDGITAPIGRSEFYFNTDPANQFAQLYNYNNLYPDSTVLDGVLSPAGLSDKMATDYDAYRGFLTQQLDYNSAGNIVHKTVNTYNFSYALNPTFDNPNYYSLPVRRGYTFVECTAACSNCIPWDGCSGNVTYIWASKASVNCPWITKTATADTTYDVNGANPIGKVQNFYYDDPTHALITRVTTVDSKGDSLLTVNRYAPDQAQIAGLSTGAANALTTMTAANKIATPIQVEHYNNGSLLNLLRTDYTIWNSTPLVVEPQRVWYGVLSNPLQDRVDYYQYDTSGNVLEVSKTGDAHHAYIWDYQHQHMIAEVVNAQQSDIAYTSFESDGTGNWIMQNNFTDPGISGRYAYNLYNGTMTKTGLNASTTYIVSYWTNTGHSFSVTGSTSVSQGKTVQGWTTYPWTFFKHTVTGVTSVTISGVGDIDEVRLYPATAQMTTYTYDPLVGMTSQMDAGSRATYYEYDGLQRLKRVRDQDYNILKTIEYQYQTPAGCGSSCYTVAMQTFAGTNTISYPVGVFDVNGRLAGNASTAADYITIWNRDTADARVGTLALGKDSMHFNITVNAGQTLPSGVTGLRYYQLDLPWNQFDAVRQFNCAYVDFGDGTGMRMPAVETDTPAIHPPNTTYNFGYDFIYLPLTTYYYIHSYPDTSLKTITCYHNDGTENTDFDNISLSIAATSLTKLRNFRGNLPANSNAIGGSCYQQAGMTSLAGILNWNQLSSIQYFRMNMGDGVNACTNISYPQDFMAKNKGLLYLQTRWGNAIGVGDPTFKISRLKSDWNTYFTHLQHLSISERDWNHEDLTQLKELSSFSLACSTTDGSTNPNGPWAPIDPGVVDNVLIQIANGAGRSVRNGGVIIATGGGGRTSASQAAINQLTSMGWTVNVDGPVTGN